MNFRRRRLPLINNLNHGCMKPLSLFVLVFLISNFSFSQIDFGIKGGLNFDSAGEAQLTLETKDHERKSGFHIGVYSEFDFLIGYLRPELQFTNVKTQLEGSEISTNRIELPVSFGLKLFGPLSFFVGPTAYYSLSQKSSNYSFDAIKDKTTFGLHLGTRLNIGSVGIDLRYERGLSPIQTTILTRNGVDVSGNVDSRPNQFLVGVSYKLK